MARTSRIQPRRGGARSKARKLMAVCLGGVLLFSGGGAVSREPVEGLLRRFSASGADETQEGTPTNSVATCTSATQVHVTATPATLTLSKSSLTATVECLGEANTAGPAGEEDVCDGQTTKSTGGERGSTACRIGSTEAGQTVTLQTLLGATHKIQWTTNTLSETPEGESRTLKLSQSDLPRTDKTFVVGCQKGGSDPNSACKVTVNVNARPSSADDKNVVTCAYGKDSNPKPVKVEMSQNKNTLTIDCGSGGSLQPAGFTSQYCSPDTDNLEECATASYSGILPKFAPSWWTNTEKGTPAVLTIPKTDFPSTDQRFLLGCAPTSTAPETPDEASRQPEADSTTSACRVLVTVKAASSASSASFNPQVIAATSGAVLLTGLFSGSS
ncbi:srs domain-containing protein [Neospora caninum Liverpool]|uniref:Srs domain-containing protein n=1 Tax=Neospora caninum (strain Liverpool) TaxID=572307 RepID=F0V8C3_NEOCL|nr:srs domain-containing protein [Neospora caninum Liverpool]CBZ49964.1 srs domain-containing protein [Neospora caninum Liverpool]CEL64552.1 TPA: SRS domain-containing protein [Neospora caninum Liverpool]|eukprot:XP_003879999.1 srs domain-containing protein [Neospora caninum Liverpool]